MLTPGSSLFLLANYLMWHTPPADQLPASTPNSKSSGWWAATVMDWGLFIPSARGNGLLPSMLQGVWPAWTGLGLQHKSHFNHWLEEGGGRWASFEHLQYFIILNDLLNSFLERDHYNLNIYCRKVTDFSNKPFSTFTAGSNREIKFLYANFCLQKLYVCPKY